MLRAALLILPAVLLWAGPAATASATHMPVGACSPGYESVKNVDPETYFDGKHYLTICLDGDLARCEPAALRYRLLHVAARLVRTGRRCHLKIDRDWPWAVDLATAFARLRAAPWPV